MALVVRYRRLPGLWRTGTHQTHCVSLLPLGAAHPLWMVIRLDAANLFGPVTRIPAFTGTWTFFALQMSWLYLNPIRHGLGSC